MIPDPTYITASQVQSETLLTGLSDLATDSIDKLIKRAESQIDRHVGRQPHHPEDDNTDRVFPRAIDDHCGTAFIPLDITEAAFAQVEYLFIQWWPSSSTSQPTIQKQVASEDIGGDGSYSATYANEGKTSAGDELCSIARNILDNGYVNRFVPLSVTDPDEVPLPT